MKTIVSLIPLSDHKYLPSFETKPSKPRCKFSGIEDNLLYIGVS